MELMCTTVVAHLSAVVFISSISPDERFKANAPVQLESERGTKPHFRRGPTRTKS